MAATVSSATFTGIAIPARHSRLGPFISSAGNVYVFARATGSTGNTVPLKASDPMSAFTAQTARLMSSGSIAAIEAMSCFQVGDVIHVVTQASAGGVYYNYFDMSTDTWGLATSEIAIAPPSLAPTSGTTFISLVVRSTGEPVVIYSAGESGSMSGFNRVSYTRRTGVNTWTAGVAVDTGGSVTWVNGVAVLGASDRVHFFLRDGTNNNAYQRTLSAANALETSPNLITATSIGAAWMSITPGASYDSGGSTVVAVATTSQTPNVNRVMRLTSADAPTVAIENVSSVTVYPLNNQYAHSLVAKDTTLHYLYSDPLQDLLRDNDGGTGTWGTDVNELTATITQLSANLLLRSGNYKIAVLLNDNAVIKYAEIDQGAADSIPPANPTGLTATVITATD